MLPEKERISISTIRWETGHYTKSSLGKGKLNEFISFFSESNTGSNCLSEFFSLISTTNGHDTFLLTYSAGTSFKLKSRELPR